MHIGSVVPSLLKREDLRCSFGVVVALDVQDIAILEALDRLKTRNTSGQLPNKSCPDVLTMQKLVRQCQRMWYEQW